MEYDMPLYYHSMVSSSSSVFFFLASSQPLQIGCLPYFHTWCGLSANLRCRPETCCTRLAANTGRKKSSKICHLGTIAQLCWLYLFGSVTARHSSSGHQPNFAALNRRRRLYSAGRSSRWALAHISSY